MGSQAKRAKLEDNVNEDNRMETEEDYDVVAMLNNPVSMLNEYAQKNKILFPVYGVASEMGDPHSRIFCMHCVFMDFKTEGTDKTKQEAKKKAAEEMVYLLVSKGYLPRTTELKTVSVPLVQTPEVVVRTVNKDPVTNCTDIDNITNPIGRLQEHCMQNVWKMPVYEEIGIIDGQFHCKCKCRNLAVTGTGFRKQVAKTNAALKMFQLIQRTESTGGSPTYISKLDKKTICSTPPRSPLKTLNSEVDAVDSDSTDSFQESFVEQSDDQDEQDGKYSISLLHELLALSNVSKPEFEFTDSEERSGLVYTCFCRVIILETCGFGRSKIEAKSGAADSMVRKILTSAKSGETETSSEEQKKKIIVYLKELQLKEFGGYESQHRNDEIVKKWLDIRKKFPSAKAKPKNIMDCKERHCFFKNLGGHYINILRNSSGDELENFFAKGMDFLQQLGAEQSFTFRKIKISSYGKDQLCVLTMDADVPVAFHGIDESTHGAVENCIRNCIRTLKLLIQ